MLADIAEKAPVALLQLDADGIILWANRAQSELLGYARQAYIGKNAADFYSDPSEGQKIMARLVQGETLREHPANLRAHGVSFALASTVFKDPFAIELVDDREDYGEERLVIIGMAEGRVLLFVAHTERTDRIRIISARRATQYEQDSYFQQVP